MTIQEISEIIELEKIIAESFKKPVLIFKHSRTCPISTSAKKQVDDYAAQYANELPIYQLIVQEARPLSNEIAARLNITHQSPQLILVKNGQPLWDCSHHRITKESIKTAVDKIKG